MNFLSSILYTLPWVPFPNSCSSFIFIFSYIFILRLKRINNINIWNEKDKVNIEKEICYLCHAKKYLLKLSEMVKSYMKIKYVLYNYPIGYKNRGEV